MWIRKTVPEDELEAECLLLLHPAVELGDLLTGGLEAVLGRPQVPLPLPRLLARLTHLGRLVLVPGLAIKNPPKKPTLKKPTKNGSSWVFLNFLFFMKIIQTFHFETDF